jgi:hypothetical protein
MNRILLVFNGGTLINFNMKWIESCSILIGNE